MNVIGCGQSDSWQEEDWAIPATNEEFAEHYPDLAPDLLELIRKSRPADCSSGDCAIASR